MMEGYGQHWMARSDVSLAAYRAYGDGRPVVFQHGLCGAADQPAEVFPNDAGACHHVLECRGHGRSDAGDPSGFSIAGFAVDLANFIEDRGLGPCPVGGISMGAAIASRLAVMRPDLVSALILARPAWVADAAPANVAPNAEVGRLLTEHKDGEAAKVAFLASSMAKRLREEAPDNLASLTGFFARDPRDVTAALLTRIAADGPGVSREALAGLDLPTLVIGTAADAIHPMETARELADLMPNARLVEIPPKSQGRAAYRGAFADALRSFLEDLA